MNLIIKIGQKRNTTGLVHSNTTGLVHSNYGHETIHIPYPYFKHVTNIFWALDKIFFSNCKYGPQIQGQTRTNMIVTFQDGRRTLGRD